MLKWLKKCNVPLSIVSLMVAVVFLMAVTIIIAERDAFWRSVLAMG